MVLNTALRFRYLTLLVVICIVLCTFYVIPQYEWTLASLRFKTSLKNQNDSENSVIFNICDPQNVSISSPCLCYLDSDTSGDIALSPEDTRKVNIIETIRCAMTFVEGGRMGNVIGQYATLLTLSRLNRRPALMTSGMAKLLRKYFKISMPSMSDKLQSSIKWTNYGIHDRMTEDYARVQGNYVKFNGFPSSYTFQHAYRTEIRREFTLRDEINDRAQKYLRGLTSNRTSVTFVGVHVRRGDYVNLMNTVYRGVLADSRFFAEATDYFRSRYSDAVFVVVSNEMDWCKKNIPNGRGDVYYLGNGKETDPIGDFSIMVNCNHSIITVGTYSYFSALFAGGQVVYLTNFTTNDSVWRTFFHFDSAFPPEWHPIEADLSPWYNNTLKTST